MDFETVFYKIGTNKPNELNSSALKSIYFKLNYFSIYLIL